MRLPIALALMAIALSTPAQAMGLAPHIIHFPADGLLRTAGVAFGCLFAVMLYFVATDWPRDANTMASKIAMGAMAAFLVLCSTGAFALDSDGTEPDPVLTPGAVETQDLDILCHHKTAERRHTTQSEKTAAFTAYGLANKHAGWCAGPHGCSVDHRVPLECGGADVPANLWPETGDGAYNQEDKNRLEGLCKRMICQGKITPAEGQAWFLGDWKAEYDRRFGAIKGK